MKRALRCRGAGLAALALAALASLAPEAPAGAAAIEAEVAGHVLALPLPEGYCALDRSREYDRELDEQIDRVMSAHDVYLAGAIDCAELAALEDAPGEGFTTYLIWLAAGDGKGGPALYPDTGRADFIAAAAEEAPGFDTEALSEEATEAWQEELDSDAFGVESLEMGALGHDGNAYYVTGLARVDGANRTILQAGITIGTLVHGVHVLVYLYRPFEGPRTFEALEQDAKALASALLAANPDSDPGAGALGLGGDVFVTLLRGALIGALAGAAIGAAIWFIRRLRRDRTRRFG
jgi:hypothetical protein